MANRQLVIGLLEDDPDQAALFRLWLEEAGYLTHHYPQAAEFRRKLGPESIDLLLLDWNLADRESGIDVLHALREGSHSRLPVLFVTARNEEADIVAGLRAGADDYLTKPPKQGELLARVAALLRRVGIKDEAVEDEQAPPYRIEVPRRRVTLDAREIELTEREFELALFLFRRRGRVVSREALLEGVWNLPGDAYTRTVDTHISRLRKKLELSGEHGWRLNSVYQHGYRLEQA